MQNEKYYLVTTHEVSYATWRINARTKKEAIELVKEGEGFLMSQEPIGIRGKIDVIEDEVQDEKHDFK